MNAKRMGRLGLSEADGDALVSFLPTLSDGFHAGQSSVNLVLRVDGGRGIKARQHTTFAKSTPRQPNNRMVPAANGTSGIRVAEMAASATTATISKASEPSSTNSPIN